MPKLQTIVTNFTAGEFSPRLRGRVDLEKYNASARLLENCVVLRHGGVTARPSRDYLGEIKDSSKTGRIIPFIYSRTDAYIIELGDQVARVWKNGARVESSPGVAYEFATPWTAAQLASIDYAQGGDTIIVTHPDVYPQRIARFSDALWLCANVPFDPPAVEEIGHGNAAVTLTLSAATVGTGRTCSASGGVFLPTDVGRTISATGGAFVVTAYSSATSVTGTITQPFVSTTLAGSAWRLEGSPRAYLKPFTASPVGATCYLEGSQGRAADLSFSATNGAATCAASAGVFLAGDVGKRMYVADATIDITGFTDAQNINVTINGSIPTVSVSSGNWAITADTWRAADVGSIIVVNGGVLKIEAQTATRATTRIVRELSGTPVAYPLAWQLLAPAWSSTTGYPTSCTFFEQRLWLAGTRRSPQTMWGSRTALPFDFTPGTEDDAAVYKTLDSDDVNVLQYLASMSGLVSLTYGGEFSARGGVEKPITQLNAQIKKRSKWGCAAVRPEEAGAQLLFVQRDGKAIRSLSPDDVSGFVTRDISVFSDHLVSQGIKWMTWQQSPERVMWLGTVAGELLALTYSDEQQVVAFCSGNAEGAVEWGATIPAGDDDETYLLVRYTVNGTTRRYLERVNWAAYPGQDCRSESVAGLPETSWPSYAHLAGKTVNLVLDGVHVGEAVVSTAGVITTPRAGLVLSAGLPYVPKVELQAPEVGTGVGTAQGQAMSTHKVRLQLLDTIGCYVNDREVDFRQFDLTPLDAAPVPFTGSKVIGDIGWEDGESTLTIEQRQPYPWTLLAVVRSWTVNQG